ncbi:MAG: GtrA family protein [Candidatus Hodarchaeota archaeon]
MPENALNKSTNLLDQSKHIFGQFAKFWIISLIGLALNNLITWFFTEFIFNNREWYLLSITIAIGLVTLWNFGLNKLWTFKGEGTEKDVKVQGLQYAIVGAIGAVENLGIAFILVEFVLGVDFYLLANLIGIITAICSNFLLNKFWTFKDRDL